MDSELAWLPLLKMNVPLDGPLPNLLFNATNHTILTPLNGVLMVSRLDGPTPEIANGLVDKALAAEKDGLWGRAYFDTRNEQTNDVLLSWRCMDAGRRGNLPPIGLRCGSGHQCEHLPGILPHEPDRDLCRLV